MLAALGSGAMLWSWVTSVERYPVWLDEFVSVSTLELSPLGVLGYYATAKDPQLPTYFILVKPWYDLAEGLGLNVAWIARLGTIGVSVTVVVACLAIILASRQRVAGAIVFLSGIAVLAGDAAFAIHAIEARMYGLLALTFVLLIAAVVARQSYGVVLAGSLLILLHPIAVVVGAPACIVALAGEAWLSIPRKQYRRIVLLAAPFLFATAVVAWLALVKYVPGSQTVSIDGDGGSGLGQILWSIDGLLLGAAVLISGLALAAGARRRTEAITVPATLLAVTLAVVAFKLGGAALPFSILPVTR